LIKGPACNCCGFRIFFAAPAKKSARWCIAGHVREQSDNGSGFIKHRLRRYAITAKPFQACCEPVDFKGISLVKSSGLNLPGQEGPEVSIALQKAFARLWECFQGQISRAGPFFPPISFGPEAGAAIAQMIVRGLSLW
jgi:hypothetical protein